MRAPSQTSGSDIYTGWTSAECLPMLRLPSPHLRLQAHDPAYVERFCSGALDDAAVKRIGFGAVARSQVLIERTLAEVAGAAASDMRMSTIESYLQST